jgi:hypothetical protein
VGTLQVDPLENRIIVSIQLISPASGDKKLLEKKVRNYSRFHSINIPSEWGQRYKLLGSERG